LTISLLITSFLPILKAFVLDFFKFYSQKVYDPLVFRTRESGDLTARVLGYGDVERVNDFFKGIGCIISSNK